MDKRELEKRKLLDEIQAESVEKLNGAIMRTIGHIFGFRWRPVSELMVAFRGKDESEMYYSLSYLQLSGYIQIREKESKSSVDINDFDLEDVEVRLLPKGSQLCMLRIKDELVKI